MNRPETKDLVAIYKDWPQEKIDEEVSALFDLAFALLEVCECDSFQSFPNPNIKLTISCEVMKDKNGRFYN
jgi:hypothetical protein